MAPRSSPPRPSCLPIASLIFGMTVVIAIVIIWLSFAYSNRRNAVGTIYQPVTESQFVYTTEQ